MKIIYSVVSAGIIYMSATNVVISFAAASDTIPKFENRFTDQLGCDESFVIKDPESTIVLSVQVPGILERSVGKALPYSETIEIGSPGLTVMIEQGGDLDHWCTDIMARPPRIDAVWTAVSGSVTVDILERDEKKSADGLGNQPGKTTAMVSLTQVILADKDDRELSKMLPDLTITAIIGVPGGG